MTTSTADPEGVRGYTRARLRKRIVPGPFARLVPFVAAGVASAPDMRSCRIEEMSSEMATVQNHTAT